MNIIEILEHIERTPNSAFFYTPNIYEGMNFFFKKTDFEFKGKGKDKINECLSIADELRTSGKVGYCLIPYETGYLFEERLQQFYDDKVAAAEFYFSVKENYLTIPTNELNYTGVPERLRNSVDFIVDFKLSVDKDIFERNINRIRDYIKSGDTYQVNYTVEAEFEFAGSAAELFLKLIFNQSAKYSCIINTGREFILSISPELFFEVSGNSMQVKPMKGTIERGIESESDSDKINELANSRKDRAENIMIVDLLRNDIGKISEINSVKPENVYEIEKYETLFQMVSCVRSQLKKNSFKTVIENIFPCGSITGAPKIRTMEIIRELEKRNRGIYTGAIGVIGKNFMNFNVAIRTIIVDSKGNGKAGLGSGIVWDSNPEGEYEETLAKGKFIAEPLPYFELIETMLVELGEVLFLEKHLERLEKTAEYFLFKFEKEKILNAINRIADETNNDKKYKLRLLLNKWGKINLSSAVLIPPENKIKIILSSRRTNSRNKFLRFKTTNRELYDSEYKKYSAQGYADVIFFNEKEEVTEGAITNIFAFINERWKTPHRNSGILPGIYREYFIEMNDAAECKLTIDNLLSAEKLILTNSVRGEICVDEIYNAAGKHLKNYLNIDK